MIFGAPEDGIRILSNNCKVHRNLIGNIYERSLWAKLIGSNNDFDGMGVPAGIDFKDAASISLQDNVVAGVDGPCFHGKGEPCDPTSEPCSANHVPLTSGNEGNMGNACIVGYWIMKLSLGSCQKVSGFYFHHIQSTGIYIASKSRHLMADDNVVVDSSAALYGQKHGPNAESKAYDPETDITFKNNVLIGRSEYFDCSVDSHNIEFNAVGSLFYPAGLNDHTGFVCSDFMGSANKFPNKPQHKSGIKTPAIYGQTCVLNNKFINFDGKCGNTDTVLKANRFMVDYSHPTYFKEGNEYIRSGINAPEGSAQITQFHRPKTSFVNIADCVDLHCDGHKKQLIVDEIGDLIGYKGSIFSESEYKWEGVTRNGHTYVDTQPGLGDYRIPRGMLTTLDGKRIRVEDYAPEKGVIRDENCVYDPKIPAWFCKEDTLTHFMMNYQFMDVDHMVRRLTPLAIRSETGYIDVVNGPADHSCCVGYACMIRLNTYWTTQACGHIYDYYFTSTLPKRMNFHLPDYVNKECKIYLTFYTAKPNRIDVKMDGIYMVPTNGKHMGDKIEWERPRRDIHLPTLDSDPGTNFFDRQEQVIIYY